MSGSPRNLESVHPGVSIASLTGTISKQLQSELKRIFPEGIIRVWAMSEFLDNQYASIQKGDFILFIPSGTGEYRMLARVREKQRNIQITKILSLIGIWRGIVAEQYQNLIILSDVSPISIPKSKINKVLGYNERFTPQAPIIISDDETSRKLLREIVVM
jgi:hypothetical protein